MGSTVSAPPPRDYAQETRDTLAAQIDLAPARYAAEAQYQPKYAALNLSNAETALNGTGDQRGLLSLYENDIRPALSRIEASDKEARTNADLALIKGKAGEVTSALRQAAGTAGLVDTMSRQAQEGLDAGASLDPSLANEVAQGVRAGQASRGFGFGSPELVQEAFARGSRGEALRNSRRAFARDTVNTLQQTGGDPVMALLGRPSQVLGMTPGVAGQGQGFSPGSMFNPESSYAGDVANTNFNADAAARIATANNETAVTAAGISAAGNMASSL